MKRILPALLCLALAGCELVETGFTLGSPRGRDTARSRRDSTAIVNDPSPALSDTVIYFSAVVFPDGYDWHRDTASATVDARIVLYRNMEVLVSIPAGGPVSTDADMHHIIGGKLYTEGPDGGRTIIACNGEEVLRFEGEEFLKGLLVKSGSIYTLSQKRGASGITLRKDGTVLFSKEQGNIFGSLSDASCPESGALYEDGGDHVFCYWAPTSIRKYYCVRNGCEELISNFSSGLVLEDLRYIRGKQWAVPEMFNGFSWEDARFWHIGEMPALCGTAKPLTGYGDRSSRVLRCEDFSMMDLGLPGAYVLAGDKGAAAVLYGRDGTVTVSRPGSGVETMEGTYTYISDRCCAICGDLFVMALSPASPGSKPSVIIGGSRHEVDINGFISAVAISVGKED